LGASKKTKRPGRLRLAGVAALLLVGCVLASVSLASRAQQPQAPIPPPRFEITRFDVQGNTVLSPEAIQAAVSPFTGKNKDFADIQRALEALEQSYRDRGYGVVQVMLPEQDITTGVVQFRVVQPRVGRVLIDGNKHFDAENIRRSLPRVKEGGTPNSREIARNLQLLGEHPVKQTNVLLRSGAKEGEVDVNIKVNDDKPWRGFLTLDNTGTGETGYYRIGIGYQHSNLFNRDHTLTAQYITSPTEPDKVSIYGVGYRIPFYDLYSSLDIIAGYSDVDSGMVQGLFNVSGAGTIGIARWNYLLPRWGELEQKLSFGLDYREFQNDVIFAGVQIVPDITIHPVSLTYSGLRRYAAAELSFFGSGSTNIPGGNDGDDLAFQLSRPGASENYTIIRGGFNYVRQFHNEWQTRLGVNGQYTKDLLVSGEQYGIGGPDTVRGYLLREIANDRGYSGQAELYTPDVARHLKTSVDLHMRFLAFYDYGSVTRNDPLPGEIAHSVLASTGVGLRLSYANSLSVRVDVANILKRTPNREDGSWRVSAALAIIY
jgi:hemolysin activation/secretion protein